MNLEDSGNISSMKTLIHLRSMSRLGTDYRLDAGLISLAGAEFFLSIAVTALCARQIFGTNFNTDQRGVDSLASVVNRANSTLVIVLNTTNISYPAHAFRLTNPWSYNH